MYATKNLGNVIVEFISKNDIPYDFIHRSRNMDEASSTRNMDVCVVDENKVINTSQKRTTSALVTITQKKAKSKKDQGSKYSSLWLGFHALNIINKQKELPIESGETTRELMKRKIDFDEAKEMQNARPFPHMSLKKNGHPRGKMGKKDNTIISPNFHLMWKLMRMNFLLITKYQFTLNLVSKNGNEM